VNGDWSSGNDIPNPDLVPEKVLSAETGIKSRQGSQRTAVSVYYSWHNDLIARQYVDPGADGIPGTSDDLYQFRNIARAVIAGVEASLDARLAEAGDSELRLVAAGAYTYGQNQTDDEPVRRIPPLNGTLGLRMEAVSGKWWCELLGQFASRQDRLSSGDISDKRIPATGTPGWGTINLRGGVHVTEAFSVNMALMNLGDVRYRYHGSGIDAPGFNAVLSTELKF
jgi:outer membrane receptor protein involved in Fe transport